MLFEGRASQNGCREPLLVYRPRTWLLREGWKKSGSISYREVPSTKR